MGSRLPQIMQAGTEWQSLIPHPEELRKYVKNENIFEIRKVTSQYSIAAILHSTDIQKKIFSELSKDRNQ